MSAVRTEMSAALKRSVFAIGMIGLVCVGLASSCTDRQVAHWKAYGDHHIVKLHAADGHVIQEWESTGKVECSDGGICWFMDSKTKKLVGTTGDIVVYVK